MLYESRPIRHHGMSYAPSAFPLVIDYQYVKEPTILLSDGESNPTVSYASRAGHSALAKSILATLSRAYRHPPRSLSSDPTANPVGRKKVYPRCCQAPLFSMPLHCCGSYHPRHCAIRWGACKSLPRGHCLFVVRSGIEPDTVRMLSFCYPLQTYSHTT
jgi:hypothetical protein